MYSMRKGGPVFAAAAVLAITATAQKKEKEEVPEAAIYAKYVYVEAYDGPVSDPNVSGADRRAILDVERAIREWGHYQLVLRQSEAEMVLQIRTGRIAETSTGGGVSVDQIPTRVGLPPSTRTNTTAVAIADAGPRDDLLFVYIVGPEGQLGARIWHKIARDGLEAPELKLFQKFKDDVNATIDAQAKKKAAGAANPAGGSATAPNGAPNPAPPAAPNPPTPKPAPPGS